MGALKFNPEVLKKLQDIADDPTMSVNDRVAIKGIIDCIIDLTK